jgi:hypothetical protein
VGRIPTWDEFWGGKPPTNLRTEIPHTEVDAFLSSLMGGAAQAAKSVFEESQAYTRSILPTRIMLGHGSPKGGGPSGPLGPNPRDPMDPREVDRSRQGAPNDCWERICCIGLDTEKREVTAIIEITQIAGYGGDLCSSTAFESVGFWLIEPSLAEVVPNPWPDSSSADPVDPCAPKSRFLGAKKITIADIMRNRVSSIDCSEPLLRYEVGSLRYAVSLALTDSELDYMKACSDSSPRLPVLHAVVAWNQEVKNVNMGGKGIRFGDWDSKVVQYPVFTTKTLSREIALGLLQTTCPYVRYSNVVWPREVPRIEYARTGEPITDTRPVALDKLAVDITHVIKQKMSVYGSMRIFAVSAEDESHLKRSCVILPPLAQYLSQLFVLNELPSNGVVTPFDLDPGDWLVCACFGQKKEIPVTWNPERDLVLTGYGESNITTCVGLLSDFHFPDVTVGGPRELDLGSISYRHAENVFEIVGLPPCVKKKHTDTTIEIKTVKVTELFYFPVKDSASSNDVLINPNGEANIIIICVANGTDQNLDGTNPERNYYYPLIEQFVLMGAGVVLLRSSHNSGEFFLSDTFRQIDSLLMKIIDEAQRLSYLLIGQSQGGNQVRKLISSPVDTMDGRQTSNIKGGVMLAPAFVGDLSPRIVLPSMIIAGGLDGQTFFTRLICKDEKGNSTKELSTYSYSWITIWERSMAQHSYLVFAPGGTHFRWLSSGTSFIDDFESSGDSQYGELENKLLLGDLKALTVQPKFSVKDRAVLLCYCSYFYQAFVLNRVNFRQLLGPDSPIPPDFVRIDAEYGEPSMNESVHSYERGWSEASINKLNQPVSDNAKPSFYRGSKVTRRVMVDGIPQSPVELVDGIQSLIKSDQIAAFSDPAVIFIGQHIKFTFSFDKPLRVDVRSRISIEFTILDGMYRFTSETFPLEVQLMDAKGIAFPSSYTDKSMNPNSYKRTKYYPKPDLQKSLTEVQGEVFMLNQVCLPVSWFFGSCLDKKRPIIDETIDVGALMIEIGSEVGPQMSCGLGKVQMTT